jgi:hypothetical protein
VVRASCSRHMPRAGGVGQSEGCGRKLSMIARVGAGAAATALKLFMYRILQEALLVVQ